MNVWCDDCVEHVSVTNVSKTYAAVYWILIWLLLACSIN